MRRTPRPRMLVPRLLPGGGREKLAAEEVWDGWEWLRNPAAPSAEELARWDVIRPYSHHTRVDERAAEKARQEAAWREDDYGELAREHMYEREGYMLGLRAARIFGECDDDFDGDLEGGGALAGDFFDMMGGY